MKKLNTTKKIFTITLVFTLLFHGISVLAQENSTTLHTIKKGESLWSISKNYDVSVEDIIKINPGVNKNNIKVNQTLKIPNNLANTGELPTYHIVKKGETLYSIALKYDCKVNELRKLNHNISVLKIGDKIFLPKKSNKKVNKNRRKHIVSKGETLYFISKKYSISVDDLKSFNKMKSNTLYVGRAIYLENEKHNTTSTSNKDDDINNKIKDSQKVDEIVSTTNKETNIEDDDIVLSDDDGVVKEVREEGFAELIESNIPSKKYTALHKTAKKHTLIKVKNKMNKKWLYVRVIGYIPDDGSTDDNVLLKISPAAFKKLGGVDKKFPVSIHYLN